jgi:hypothetical protein
MARRRKWTPTPTLTNRALGECLTETAPHEFERARHYATVESWVADAIKPQPAGVSTSRNSTDSSLFRTCGTLDDAAKLALNGWPEGRARVAAISAEIRETIRREVTAAGWEFDVAGAVPDVARYLAGEPENMLTPADVPTPARVVRIVANIGTRCGVSAEAMIERGAATCALVDCLEAAGVRAEIVAASRCEGREHHTTTITIKLPEEPLDVDRVAFMLCHPAALRRLQFSLRESLPEETRGAVLDSRYSSGGATCSVDYTEPGAICTPALTDENESHWTKPAAVRAWILEQLAAQGVTIEPQTETNAAA